MTNEALVKKVDTDVQPETFEIPAFDKDALPDGMSFDISVSADVIQRFRKRAIVSNNLPGFGTFQIITDEGKLGDQMGEDQAPSPLHYFTVGSAFCLMSHLLLSMKVMRLKIADMRIEMRIRYRTNFNPYGGQIPDPSELMGWAEFQETHVLIDSEEPEEKIRNLVDWSCRACMAENSLSRPTPVKHYAHLNGKQLD